ncbi:MAG: hypothetical protein QOI98_51 [Solirubrobacteraceae bacterium]|nr:hypothetical protein [Solirubrobacteraceae bacterium]
MRVASGHRSRVSAWLLTGLSAIVLVVSVAGVAGAQNGGATDNPALGAYAPTPPTVVGQVEAGTAPAPVTPPASGVVGETQKSAPKAAVKTKVVERGTLPFTGLEISLMLGGAFALLGLGLALRRAASPQPA